MKLIACKKCKDVIGLDYENRSCKCGLSGGRYNEDGDTVTVTGPCRVIGMENGVRYGMVARGECFLIREPHPKIRRL